MRLRKSSFLPQGFTLIELLIAVAVVAILAGIALPSYQESVRSARRTEAHNSLMAVQMAQENWRAKNVSYGTLTNIGVNGTSETGLYTITVSAQSATGYTAQAAPVTGSAQANDVCGTLTITVLNGNVTQGQGGGTAAQCWRR